MPAKLHRPGNRQVTLDDLVAAPSPQPIPADPAHRRREAFRQANASLALEGLIMTPEDLTLQEQVISGVLSTDQASALVLAISRQPR